MKVYEKDPDRAREMVKNSDKPYEWKQRILRYFGRLEREASKKHKDFIQEPKNY